MTCLEPSGYHLISKAEVYYESGDSKRALNLLNEALKKDYGTCAHSYFEAYGRITDLRVRIHMDRQDYPTVRRTLHYAPFYIPYFDSLKIKSFQLQYGVDSLRIMIDESLSEVTFKNYEHRGFAFAFIPLSNGLDTLKVKSKVELEYDYQHEYGENDTIIWKYPDTNEWIAKFKSSNEYRMIKEPAVPVP